MKLQRDQVVAASLVGTVVVVLGFASGIGQVPRTQATQIPAQKPPVTSSPTHENHVPQPVAHNPVMAHPPAPHIPAPTHPHTNVPPRPTTPTTPTKPTDPSEPCDAGAIGELLRDLGVDELPVVGELVDGTVVLEDLSIVDGLLGGLLGETKLPVLTDLLGPDCRLVVDEKTNRITGLLATP